MILDAETMLFGPNTAATANDYQHMEVLRRHVPSLPISTSEEFLARHPQFLILHARGFGWTNRLASSGRYDLSLVAQYPNGDVVLARRRSLVVPELQR
jgi:hypothetical protein